MFYYPMNLHYSKTGQQQWTSWREFYSPMNLHYSKTSKEGWSCYQCMYHRTFNCILSYRLPFVKNILTTIFMQVCSTTLQFCTSSAPQRDIWSCYRRKMHANTLLQNTRDYVQLVLSVLLPYEFTLLQNQVTLIIYYIISFTTLEFTLLQNKKYV